MSATPLPAWHALNFADLIYEHWDEEYLVFNPRSGDTHVLNQVAFTLLQGIAESPGNLHMLADRYLDDRAQIDTLAEHLDQLELIGLACRKRPA